MKTTKTLAELRAAAYAAFDAHKADMKSNPEYAAYDKAQRRVPSGAVRGVSSKATRCGVHSCKLPCALCHPTQSN